MVHACYTQTSLNTKISQNTLQIEIMIDTEKLKAQGSIKLKAKVSSAYTQYSQVFTAHWVQLNILPS